MRSHLQGWFMVACALAGLLIGVKVVTLDAPVYLGLVYGDYPDPDRPGHLKGSVVSMPELMVSSLLAVALLAAAGWLWRCLRKSDDLPAA